MSKNKEYSNYNFLEQFLGQQIYNEDILIIKNHIMLPNYLKLQLNNIVSQGYQIFEFNHQVYKIFYLNQENEKLNFYETNDLKINKNDIVFDCGGNMGIFAADAANKAKMVYSFEPMSLIRKNLYNTASLYNNINIIPKGIWKENSNLIFLQKDNPACSCAIDYTIDHHKTMYKEKCSVITLDSFIKENNIVPSFLKIDIEGSEYQMLDGGLITFNEIIPKISIALHHDDKVIINDFYKKLNHYHLELIERPGHNGLILLGDKR